MGFTKKLVNTIDTLKKKIPKEAVKLTNSKQIQQEITTTLNKLEANTPNIDIDQILAEIKEIFKKIGGVGDGWKGVKVSALSAIGFGKKSTIKRLKLLKKMIEANTKVNMINSQYLKPYEDFDRNKSDEIKRKIVAQPLPVKPKQNSLSPEMRAEAEKVRLRMARSAGTVTSQPSVVQQPLQAPSSGGPSGLPAVSGPPLQPQGTGGPPLQPQGTGGPPLQPQGTGLPPLQPQGTGLPPTSTGLPPAPGSGLPPTSTGLSPVPGSGLLPPTSIGLSPAPGSGLSPAPGSGLPPAPGSGLSPTSTGLPPTSTGLPPATAVKPATQPPAPATAASSTVVPAPASSTVVPGPPETAVNPAPSTVESVLPQSNVKPEELKQSIQPSIPVEKRVANIEEGKPLVPILSAANQKEANAQLAAEKKKKENNARAAQEAQALAEQKKAANAQLAEQKKAANAKLAANAELAAQEAQALAEQKKAANAQLAAQQAETDRLATQQAEQEKLAAQQAANAQLAAQQAANAELAAQQAETARLEAEQAETARLAAQPQELSAQDIASGYIPIADNKAETGPATVGGNRKSHKNRKTKNNRKNKKNNNSKKYKSPSRKYKSKKNY